MLKQREVLGEQVIVGGNGAALVASKSQPGNWHIVRDGRCDCLGYAHRGACRHIRVVAQVPVQPIVDSIPETFRLYEQTLAQEINRGRSQQEESDAALIRDGEWVSFAEWRERNAIEPVS